ncbi:excinuclease ABC subunit UvrC [Stomatohabitans albus]|uniref:excinuclease ABC subunit UvrC n=1 Tax=Stomatohabitans albus TaxID=3110766 RepID=UPI00300C62EE
MDNPAAAIRPAAGTIPTSPGCYLWRDQHGRVIYVGKAKNLRSRLNSYFANPDNLPQKTVKMLEMAASVEWLVVRSDVESLHLESNLIKQYRPRFNVIFNDDKSFPWLAITKQQAWPRVMVRRNIKHDGTLYFGPYAHVGAIRSTLDLLLSIYPVRTCTNAVFASHQRSQKPCLQYHIRRCSGPCAGLISREEYGDLLAKIEDFLKGNAKGVIETLTDHMQTAAANQAFEEAARYRDQIEAVQLALAKQHVVSSSDANYDVHATESDGLEMAIYTLFVRQGKVIGHHNQIVDIVEELESGELIARYLVNLYTRRTGAVPDEDVIGDEVLVSALPPNKETVAAFLHELKGKNVPLRVPQRGDKAKVLELAQHNAKEVFTLHRLKRAKDFNTRSQAIEELAQYLGLSQAPLRIECYDISTLQGTNTVASMVVMEDGIPRPSEYRRFKMKTVHGQDDFASMYEVIHRRFSQYLEEQTLPHDAPKKFAYPPHLILIDGGKGQLNAAVRALDDLGITGIDIASLAKKQEEVFLPGRAESIMLPRGSEALFFLIRIRDESHRFAITYHRTLRNKRMTTSVLDDIEGVGEKRRSALLKQFGSLKQVRAASVDDIAQTPGFSRALAERVVDYLSRH